MPRLSLLEVKGSGDVQSSFWPASAAFQRLPLCSIHARASVSSPLTTRVSKVFRRSTSLGSASISRNASFQ